jgi:hypothetical protein
MLHDPGLGDAEDRITREAEEGDRAGPWRLQVALEIVRRLGGGGAGAKPQQERESECGARSSHLDVGNVTAKPETVNQHAADIAVKAKWGAMEQSAADA